MTSRPALLDTSVLIARETGQSDIESVPELIAVGVMTLAELLAGVLAATDTTTRPRRLASLDAVSVVAALPVTAEAVRQWARLSVRLAEDGRTAKLNGLWIAAVAAANEMDAVSQDSDFDAIEGVGGPHVIRV